MKTVYLVRHGESLSNTGHLRAADSSPLTEAGHRQAERIAKRCAKLPLRIAVTGPSVRTKQTADIITAHTGIACIEHPLFAERRKPSAQMHKAKRDPEVMRIDVEIRDNFHIPGYRHSDEENFDDLKKRMSDALDYILSLPHEHILVVTHGIVLRLLVARAVMGPSLTGEQCERFYRGLRMHNTGMCVLKHTDDTSEEGRASAWQLWSWNDAAHLED